MGSLRRPFQKHSENHKTPIENIGRWTFFSYLGGDFGGQGPVPLLWPVSWIKDLFTDTSYRDHLVRGLDFGGYCEGFGLRPQQERIRFSDIAEQTRKGKLPRFYFNATTLESASPFVLTQLMTCAKHSCWTLISSL